MTPQNVISDDLLAAYLDGALDVQQKGEIARALDQDADLRARLAALQIPIDDIKIAFDAMLAVAPARAAMPAVSQNLERSVQSWLPMAACLVVGIFVGAGSFSLAQRPAGWMDYVAAYQALYVTQTISETSLTPAEIDANLSQLGVKLGRDISAAGTHGPLVFKRGQLLGYQGHNLVQLAYLGPNGEPVALCIIRLEGQTSSDLAFATREGMPSVQWSKGGFSFLLIGPTDKAFMQDAAQHLAGLL